MAKIFMQLAAMWEEIGKHLCGKVFPINLQLYNFQHELKVVITVLFSRRHYICLNREEVSCMHHMARSLIDLTLGSTKAEKLHDT